MRIREGPPALGDLRAEPLLEFRHAKPAGEAALAASGLAYSIVRPPAFSKSLSGRVDPATGRYDAAATSSTGTETLFDFHAKLIAGAASPERGDHAVF